MCCSLYIGTRYLQYRDTDWSTVPTLHVNAVSGIDCWTLHVLLNIYSLPSNPELLAFSAMCVKIAVLSSLRVVGKLVTVAI